MAGIRWGIIGCGNVTEVKSGPALQRADGSALVAVMRRDGALARDYAERHDVPRWYDDAEALIHDPAVDAVYIATPPSSHLAYAERVAAAGKPVYVEKPMAMTHVQCQRMIEVCAAAGVPLFVAYYRRALPRYLEVRRLLRERAIGVPMSVTVIHSRPSSAAERAGELGWRVDPKVSGGGHFLDLATHTLDLLDYLLGPITRCSGDAQNLAGLYPAEDTVSASFTLGSGVLGTGTWSFATFEEHESVTIRGSLGTLTFTMFDDTPVRLDTAAGTRRFEIPHPPHIQQPLIQQVVDALLGRGLCESTGVSAARTSLVVDRLLERYRAGMSTPPA